MNKRILIMASAIAVLVFAAASCSKDDSKKIPNVDYTITLDTPIGLDSAKLTTASATLTNIISNETFTAENFKEAASGKYVATVTIPEGTYNLSVDGKVAYRLNGKDVTGDVKTSRDGISVEETSTTPAVEVALSLYNAKDGFVIDEIFFTGTLTPAGKQYSGDQYIKITNNSDETLYADSLSVVESSFLTVKKYDYTPNLMSRAMTVEAFYMIPGTGKSVSVKPGHSLIIAIQAIDHTQVNSNSMDLSKADFEFYDVSNVPSFQDTDNPDVANMDKWYCYTMSYYTFHNRGFRAFALVKPEVGKETFLKDYLYSANYVMSLPSGNYSMTTKGYMVPNSWIVDAVNLSIESSYQWQVTDASLDAGWTYCGKVDGDKTRYGKAVRRKVTGKNKEGLNILKDTNNSTDDFDAEVKPSLMK